MAEQRRQQQQEQRQPYPADLSGKDLLDIVLGDFRLESLGTPYALPAYEASFEDVNAFVELETKVRVELLREELHRKVCGLANPPRTEEEDGKPPEKHCRFLLPNSNDAVAATTTLSVEMAAVTKVPPRAAFTNFLVVLQTVSATNPNQMHNLTLALCERFRNADGALFRLGRDAATAANLSILLPPGTVVYCRTLTNCSFLLAHFQALRALGASATALEGSPAAQTMLRGRINPRTIRTVAELDRWINDNESDNARAAVELAAFNRQQQRALALDALTDGGIVVVHGPPGTGKSHVICHGLLPQAVARNERVAVLCNSNVAVDALMLKCTDPSLQGKMLRCGFKAHVDEAIIARDLYAEGDLTSSANAAAQLDRYGNRPGGNSNTADSGVRNQIREKAVVFTTIHFASKKKESASVATNETPYWNFDTLVLDEAAQIEDSKLFILLARCPSLKKIVLVGDPKQIQPYVSDSLREQGHGKSTMERLMDSAATATAASSASSASSSRDTAAAAPFIMLERQFRMAPVLRSLVSDLFYGGRLEDAACVRSRGPVPSVELRPLLVINLTGTEMAFSRLHQSYENFAEAAVVKAVYDFLFSMDFDGVLPSDGEDDDDDGSAGGGSSTSSLGPRDVCILSPFNRHKDRLRNLICGVDDDDANAYSGHVYGRNSFSPAKKSQSLLGLDQDEEAGSDRVAQLANIDTVDKFQGSERKVVIISTCVDRRPLRAGDPHFIDVACSRAQHLLVVVGNFTDALATDPHWSLVHDRAMEVGCYVEHAVEKRQRQINNNSEPQYDLDVDGLHSKLRSLVVEGKPKPKKRRIE